jgi:hypothetical protein
MTSRAVLRASDADRDAVTERLRTAAAEGRLQTDELEERVDGALRARTYGELDRLVKDLPHQAGHRPRGQAGMVPAIRAAFGVALPIIATAIVVVAVVTAIALAAAWWAFWALVWFFMCGRGGCSMRRLSPGPRPRRTA